MKVLRGDAHKLLKDALTISVVCVFLLSFVCRDAWSVIGANGLPFEFEEPLKGQFASLDVESFALPAHLGEIRDLHQGSSNQVVIHIQDAHSNYYAQQKISNIIDFLNREYGIRVLNLEGGVGDYNLEVFTAISDGPIREEVTDYFAKKGEINGAEIFAINNPDKVLLWGVEEKDLYLKNLMVYRDSLENRSDVEKYLGELQHALNNLKRHIYGSELLDIDLTSGSFNAKNLSFKDYFEYLTDKAAAHSIKLTDYPNLFLLNKSLEEQEGINFREANAERNRLVEELKNKLSKNEIRNLVSRTIEYKTKKLSTEAFFKYLIGKATEAKIDTRQFPELSSYIGYISTYESIDRSKVMDEMDELEAQIKEDIFKNNTQRELDKLSRNFTILSNFFDLRLNKKNYEYYIGNKNSFYVESFVSFIEKEAPKYKMSVNLSANISRLDEYREKLGDFFKFSFKRDEVFLKNIRFGMLQGGQSGAILMTGGFHAENLAELFKKEGISYVSVMPKFEKVEGYESPYFDLLAGETNDLRSVIRSTIAQTSFLMVASFASGLAQEVWGSAGVQAFDDDVMIRTLAASLGKLVPEGFTLSITGLVDANGEPATREVKSEKGDPGNVALTISIQEINRYVNDLVFDPVITKAFDENRAESLDQKTRDYVQNVLELGRDYFQDNSHLKGAEEVLKVIDNMLAELQTVDINVLKGIDTSFPKGRAGKGGIHINENAIENQDDLTRAIIHELIAGYAYDHATSKLVEEIIYGEVDVKNMEGKEAALRATPLWKIEDREARWEGGRDIARAEEEIELAATSPSIVLRKAKDVVNDEASSREDMLQALGLDLETPNAERILRLKIDANELRQRINSLSELGYDIYNGVATHMLVHNDLQDRMDIKNRIETEDLTAEEILVEVMGVKTIGGIAREYKGNTPEARENLLKTINDLRDWGVDIYGHNLSILELRRTTIDRNKAFIDRLDALLPEGRRITLSTSTVKAKATALEQLTELSDGEISADSKEYGWLWDKGVTIDSAIARFNEIDKAREQGRREAEEKIEQEKQEGLKQQVDNEIARMRAENENLAREILNVEYGHLGRGRTERHYFLAKLIQQREALKNLTEGDLTPEEALKLIAAGENAVKERAYFYAFGEFAEYGYTENYGRDLTEGVINPWREKIAEGNRELEAVDEELAKEEEFRLNEGSRYLINRAAEVVATPQDKSFESEVEIRKSRMLEAKIERGMAEVKRVTEEARKKEEEKAEEILEKEKTRAETIESLNKAIAELFLRLGIIPATVDRSLESYGPSEATIEDLNTLAKMKMLEIAKMPVTDENENLIVDNTKITPEDVKNRIIAILDMDEGTRYQIQDTYKYKIEADEIIRESAKAVENRDLTSRQIQEEYFIGLRRENFVKGNGSLVTAAELEGIFEEKSEKIMKLVMAHDKILMAQRGIEAPEAGTMEIEIVEGVTTDEVVDKEAAAAAKAAERLDELDRIIKDMRVLLAQIEGPGRTVTGEEIDAIARAEDYLVSQGLDNTSDRDTVRDAISRVDSEAVEIAGTVIRSYAKRAIDQDDYRNIIEAIRQGTSDKDRMESAAYILKTLHDLGNNLLIFDIALTLVYGGLNGEQVGEAVKNTLGADISNERKEAIKNIIARAPQRAPKEDREEEAKKIEELVSLRIEVESVMDQLADEAALIVDPVTAAQAQRVEYMAQDVRTYAEAVEYADTGTEADKARIAEYSVGELNLEKTRLEKMQQAAISKSAKDRIAKLIPRINRLIEELKTPSIEAMKRAANLLIESKYGIGEGDVIQVRNIDGLARDAAIYQGINFGLGQATVRTFDNLPGHLNFANLGEIGKIADVREVVSQVRPGDDISFTLLDGSVVTGEYQSINVDLAEYPRSVINVRGKSYDITSIAEINAVDRHGQDITSRSQEKVETGQKSIEERIEALGDIGIKFSYSGMPVSVERGLEDAVQSRLDRVMAINFINSQRVDRTGEEEKTFEQFARDVQNRHRSIDQGKKDLTDQEKTIALGSDVEIPEESDVRNSFEALTAALADSYNNPKPLMPFLTRLPEDVDNAAIPIEFQQVVYEKAAAEKKPGATPPAFSLSPENRRKLLEASSRESETSGTIKISNGKLDMDTIRNKANELLVEFRRFDERIKEGSEIRGFEIRKVNFSDVEGTDDYQRNSFGVWDRGNLIVILNSNPKNKMRQMFEDDEEALAHLLAHEFLESSVEGMDHPAIKQVERVANEEQRRKGTTRLDIPLLESKELLYMTDNELEAIEPNHPNDPENVFYNAAQQELMERRMVDLMNNFRPNSAPYRIIMSVTQEQWDEIGRKRAVGLDESERKMARRAGLEALEELAKKANVKIEYYVRGDEDSFKAALTRATDDEFTQSIDSRVIAFVDTSLDAARLKDEFGTTLEAMNQSSNKISGFPREQFDNGEDYTQTILHNLLGIGLIDYKAYMEAEQYEIAQGLLTSVQKIMRYITDDSEFIKDLSSFDNMKNFLNGISILRIRKIDLNELTEQENALRQVLRAL